GACRRAAGVFDLYTASGAGTTIIARIGPGSPLTPPSPTSPIRVGGILAARPGERESGDAWGVLWRAGTITVVIMDGLGHGPEAAQAAANGFRGLAGPAGPEEPLAP